MRRTVALCAALACGVALSQPAEAQGVDESAGQGANAGSEEVVKQATELNDRGEKLYEQGDYESALPLYAEALRMHREALGERHPDTITMMSNYAVALSSLGRNEEAEPLLADALRLYREVLGEKHPDTLFGLNNYAYVLIELGRADEAEPLFAEALRLHRETLGERDPETLNSINGYAGVLYSLGRMKEAEPLFAEALRLRREELGERNPDTITSLNNYAVALQALGRMDEAEPLYAEALRLRREVLGERHPDTLSSLSVYASALHLLGRWREAEPLYAEALRLFREEVGEKHPFTITTLSNYVIVLELLGRMDQAEPLYAEALRLRRDVQGERHPATLTTLNNYAGVLRVLGRPQEAEPLSAEALRLRRETLGERHPDTLQSLNNYAFVLLALDRPDEAEPLFAEALRLRREVLGDRHPITLSSLRNYAHVLQVRGRPADALPFSRQLVSAHRARAVDLSALGVRGSEQRQRERSDRETIERSHADLLWAYATATPAGHADLEQEAFTGLQLASAGSTTPAVAEAAASRFAAGLGLQDLAQERKSLAKQWTALDEKLVKAQSGGEDKAAQREAIRTDIRAVEARISAIDAQLAVEAPQYFAILNQQAVDLAELRKILGEEEAVLLLVPTEKGTHALAVTRDAIAWQRADANRDQIADTVRRFRQGLEIESGFLPTFDLALAHQLYLDLFAPVEAALSGKKRVYVVADGALSRLPLGTLVTRAPAAGADASDPDVLRQAGWLADRYALVQLPSLQSLVFIRAFGSQSSTANADFRGFGAPVLQGRAATRGARSATIAPMDASTLAEASRADSVLPLMNPDALRQLAALPGTKQELERVRDALGARSASLFLGPAMTEAAIRTADLSHTTILHLATHAFTSEDAGSLAEPGLVFTPPATAQPLDDGYLAASEVIGLNLTSADWVILSACNTAAPSGQAGETGLSGLAQAFFYAGAQSMLVSHWPVFDDIAPELVLKTLSLSQAGLPRAEAFQQAMREVRNDPRIDAAHPAIWAPFVLVGEGR